jgi:hypothetical protein
MRQLSSLHAVPSSEHPHQQELLLRVATVLSLLLAAGAPPFHRHPPLLDSHSGPGPTPSSPGNAAPKPPGAAPEQQHGMGPHQEPGPSTSSPRAAATATTATAGGAAAAPSPTASLQLRHWEAPPQGPRQRQHEEQRRQQQRQQRQQQWPEGLPDLSQLQLQLGASAPVAPTPCSLAPPLGLTQPDWAFLEPYATQVRRGLT